MSERMKKMIQLTVGVIIGAILMWWAVKDIVQDPHSRSTMIDAMRQVPLWSHGLLIVCTLLQMVLRTIRWQIQIEGSSSKKPPLRQSMAMNAAGFAAVFFLPFRLGEFVRPALTAKAGYTTKSMAMAHSFVERIVDGLVTTIFFGALILVVPKEMIPAYVKVGGWLALAVFGGAVVVLVTAYRWRELSLRFWRTWLGKIHEGLSTSLTRMLDHFLEGLKCFTKPQDLFLYVMLTVVYWVINGLGMYALLCGLVEDPPMSAAFMVLAFLIIGVMIPAPPGNVGNFEYFATRAMLLYGFSSTTAMAYALLLHGWQIIILILWFLVFVLTGDLRRHELDSIDESIKTV